MNMKHFVQKKRTTVLLLTMIFLISCTPNIQTPTETYEAPVPVTQKTEEPEQESPVTEVPQEVASEEAPPTEAPVTHLMIPGELPEKRENHAGDYSSAGTASRKTAPGGDRVSNNSYERPFNAFTMDTYYPFIDIVDSELYLDDDWVYVNILLQGTDENGGLKGNYAVELDLDIDGRGDILVLVRAPSSGVWSTEGVQIWADGNEDVGSIRAIVNDAPNSGDGFESLLFDQNSSEDPDMGWARVVVGETPGIQLAFKRSVHDANKYFLWGTWAGLDALNPAWFDLNDYFTKEEAGSSLTGFEFFYPIKKLEALDNTCRVSVGYQPVGTEPGLCTLPGQSDGGNSCAPQKCDPGFYWDTYLCKCWAN